MWVMRIAAVALACGAVSACVSSDPITLPSGAPGQVIGCGGMFNSMLDCYRKAGEVCPHGYDIVGGPGEPHPLIDSGGEDIEDTLMVHCKQPKAGTG